MFHLNFYVSLLMCVSVCNVMFFQFYTSQWRIILEDQWGSSSGPAEAPSVWKKNRITAMHGSARRRWSPQNILASRRRQSLIRHWYIYKLHFKYSKKFSKIFSLSIKLWNDSSNYTLTAQKLLYKQSGQTNQYHVYMLQCCLPWSRSIRII